MNFLKSSIFNLVKSTVVLNASFSTFTQPLLIKTTPMLMALPMKKKKKMDVGILKIREERKRRRLWRECRLLMKHQKQLKPLDDIDIPHVLIDEKQQRLRKKPVLTTETLDRRMDLLNEWSRYKGLRAIADCKMMERIYKAQEKAVIQLKIASPRLYEEALKIDESLLPITLHGVTLTPPIKNYDQPDGEYINVTRKWDPPKLPELQPEKKIKKK